MAVIDGGWKSKAGGESTVDNGGGPPHDGDMEARIAKLEADLTAIKIDVAVIKANGATKSDIAEMKGAIGELRMATKADIADFKTSIIAWTVGAVFASQLLPTIPKIIEAVTK